MRLATIVIGDREAAALVTPGGILPIEAVNRQWKSSFPEDLHEIIKRGALHELNGFSCSLSENELSLLEGELVPRDAVTFAPLYRHPPKIWGIGLNYAHHAEDLSEKRPDGMPGSFMKADTTVIGHGDAIKIPEISVKTTGEAELAIVIGKKCRDVSRERWLEVVAGFTTVIDMTAEDILRKNTRYLTLCKNFDTFFSFGPVLVTPDEIDDVNSLEVSTVINGGFYGTNTVSNMAFPPDVLVSFHSRVMTLLPGDVISTGTPRAAPLNHGDTIEARITGFEPLVNPVVDLKNT